MEGSGGAGAVVGHRFHVGTWTQGRREGAAHLRLSAGGGVGPRFADSSGRWPGPMHVSRETGKATRSPSPTRGSGPLPGLEGRVLAAAEG